MATLLSSQDENLRAWRSARTLAILCSTVSVFAIAGWYVHQQVLYAQWIIAAVLTTACLAIVLLRPRMPASASGAISLSVLGVMFVTNVAINLDLARHGVHFEAFGVFKLAPIIVAIIAPTPLWIGPLIIGISIFGPLVVYYALVPPPMHSVFAVQEPWYTMAYAIIAAFVLWHRLHALEQERAMARLKAERGALDQIARTFLGLRDLTNTPIQSIELTARLLKTNDLTTAEASTHLERSLVRLRDMSQILIAYEQDIDWSKTSSSFDSAKLLQHKAFAAWASEKRSER